MSAVRSATSTAHSQPEPPPRISAVVPAIVSILVVVILFVGVYCTFRCLRRDGSQDRSRARSWIGLTGKLSGSSNRAAKITPFSTGPSSALSLIRAVQLMTGQDPTLRAQKCASPPVGATAYGFSPIRAPTPRLCLPAQRTSRLYHHP